MHSFKTKNYSKGFSLIEVMISVLVLAIGILAVSKLQTSLLRTGADANHRSVAASLANKKIDDLKRFAYTNDLGAWSESFTDPSDLSFFHIASHEGGLMPKGDISIGNHVYTLDWTVSHYQFSGEGNDATITTNANAGMKYVHVTVAWDSPGSTTNNIVSFDTFIHGYHPLLTAVVASNGSVDGGDINLKTRAADSEIFQLDGDSSFGSELIAPDVSKKGNSTLTKTVFSIFNTSSRVLKSSDEFRTVACLCKDHTSNDTTSRIYTVTSWDSVNKRRTDVLETRTNHPNPITKTDVDSGGGDQPAAECSTCCRDGVGYDINNDPVYTASNKICRLKLVGGKLYMTDPWKLIALNIVPESYLTEGALGLTSGEESANRSLYSGYLTTLLRTTLLNYTTSSIYNALTTVDSTFPSVASNYVVATEPHLTFNSGENRQFQARAIYMDFPAQGSFEGVTTATIPLDRIPFAEFNVANLSVWAPDVNLNDNGITTTGDTSIPISGNDYTANHDELDNSCSPDNLSGRTFVSNDELSNSCEDDYSRGFVDAHSGDNESIKSGFYTGNNGLVNRYIDPDTTAITSVDIIAP